MLKKLTQVVTLIMAVSTASCVNVQQGKINPAGENGREKNRREFAVIGYLPRYILNSYETRYGKDYLSKLRTEGLTHLIVIGFFKVGHDGSFKVKDYGGYTGRNPKNGKPVKIKPKKLPFFKVGKELKDRVDHS